MTDIGTKLKGKLGDLAKCVTSVQLEGKVLTLGGTGERLSIGLLVLICCRSRSRCVVPRSQGSEFNMIVSDFAEEHKLERVSIAGVSFVRPKTSRDTQGDQYRDQLGGNDDELTVRL